MFQLDNIRSRTGQRPRYFQNGNTRRPRRNTDDRDSATFIGPATSQEPATRPTDSSRLSFVNQDSVLYHVVVARSGTTSTCAGEDRCFQGRFQVRATAALNNRNVCCHRSFHRSVSSRTVVSTAKMHRNHPNFDANRQSDRGTTPVSESLKYPLSPLFSPLQLCKRGSKRGKNAKTA